MIGTKQPTSTQKSIRTVYLLVLALGCFLGQPKLALAQSAWTSGSVARAAAAIKAHQSKSQSDAKSQKQGGDKGGFEIQTSGVGTQNRMAKWTDSSGTLGDSLLGESGGGVELRPGSAGVGVNPTFINPGTVAGFSQLQAYPVSGPNTNSSFAVVPRGTGVTNNRAQLSLLNTDFIADSTNYEFASLRARGTDFVFGTGKSGSGVNRPFMFAAGFLSDNTTNNGQLFLATDGKVGIGTTSPGAALDVLNSVAAGTPTARFKNINAANTQVVIDSAASQDTNLRFDDNTSPVWYVGNLASNDRFRLLNSNANSNTEVFTVLQGGNVGIGTTNPQAKLDVAGNAKVTGDLTVTGVLNAKYQDVAEWVPASHAIAAGTVVILDPDQSNHVLPSMKAYDTRVAGVVSAKPGVILGEGGNGKVMVATTGRVKIKVDATAAPIRVGDLLVTSDKEGFAMRSQPLDLGGTPIHRPGTLIGKALEPLEKGTGEILVLLSLQ